MRSVRIRRWVIGGAVLALAAALAPGGFTAAAATSPTATPSPGVTAAAKGVSFDPKHAYVPGSPLTVQNSAAANTPPGTKATAGADANGGNLGLAVDGSLETAQGTPLSSPLAGGDTLQVFSLGVVTRVRSDGTTVWQRGTASLYRDWHLTFTNPGYTPTPQLVVGTDPADPFELTTAEPFALNDTHPYAVGDLTGDGATDIAVAETVGVNVGAADCGNCGWPSPCRAPASTSGPS